VEKRDLIRHVLTRQAHPEACVGTPESIESKAKELAARPRPAGYPPLPPIYLTPEPVPPGTPPGWRAFRFTASKTVIIGTLCAVAYNAETGSRVFMMNNVAGQEHAIRLGQNDPDLQEIGQTGSELQESRILIPPNGYVSPELILSTGEK
jgi:hypothetical protein